MFCAWMWITHVVITADMAAVLAFSFVWVFSFVGFTWN